jgi:hypothetical protein
MSKTRHIPTVTKEEVIEAFESETRTRQAKGVNYGWSDARSIRQEFGLSSFWRGLYKSSDAERIDTSSDAVQYPGVIPDCLIHLQRHERELVKQGDPELLEDFPEERRQILRWLAIDDKARSNMSIGGTDFLATGEPGSGKSTLATDLAARLLGVNPSEAVVWRGTPNRAEWTPLAPWTRLLVPEGVETTVTVEPPAHGSEAFELDLEDVAREVVRYSDVFDVFDYFKPGQVHVVYPDPRFEGCAELFRSSSRTPSIPFHTLWEVPNEDADEPTPLKHWWFAFMVGLVDVAGPEGLSFLIDEIGDLIPQAARSGEANHYLYELVETVRDAAVDLRKNSKSLYAFGHNEADVHSLVRRKLRWRITMPGWPNPTAGDDVVGMESAPMTKQHTKYMTVGTGIWWTSTYWTKFQWEDMPKPTIAKTTVDYPGLDGRKA